MAAAADQTAALPVIIQHITETIGTDPASWSTWPGGWPGEIGTALVDAVYSARSVYKSKHGRGIHPLVTVWRTDQPAAASLRVLAAEIREHGPHSWATTFGNTQTSPGRRADAPEGPTKAAAILQAADKLLALGVDAASDITDVNVNKVKLATRSVPGIGYATTNYFLMLLGRPGVKPDRMIHRFLRDASGRDWPDAPAEALIELAAARLGAEGYVLEHAIWSYESERATRSDAAPA